MTEATPAAPENAPALDLGRRVFARQARAESRLSPWTRQDLAGKPIVRELRFAQHIARRVYGRGAPGVTFEGQLSPNAPRGVARFSEKVAERNTLADVARKYAPVDDGVAGEAAPRTAANAPMPLAGAGAPGGEGGAPRNAGPAISAAEALQRLAVTRPDLDPDASPFAKLFKAAMGSAQPSGPTLQRASDSARRVVETFQRGGPRPKADSAPPAPIQPRTERPPAPIQRRADPSAPSVSVSPAVTPPPERPPATPSSRALRRFTKVEEVVPPNFTPPTDDFGDDLPEPGGPAFQRALPPLPGEALPLARRPEAPPPPARAPATVVQPKRPDVSTPAPKRQAKPAPAPARLQRRVAAPVARPANPPAPGARPPAQGDRSIDAPAPLQRPISDAPVEAAERTIDGPSERQAPRPSAPIQRAPAAPPLAGDPPSAPQRRADVEPDFPAQIPPAAASLDSGDGGAPPRAPIQREAVEPSSSDLPLARPARPESAPGDIVQRTPAAGETSASTPGPTPRETAAAHLDDLPPAQPVARDLPEDPARGAIAPRKPIGSSTEPPLRDAAPDTLPPAPIQRAPSEGQTAELPIARPALPPTESQPAEGSGPVPREPPPPSPAHRQTADTPPAQIQRQSIEDRAADLPLAALPEPPHAPPPEPPHAPPPEPSRAPPSEPPPMRPTVAPVQRRPDADPSRETSLARLPEPPAAAPASPIQRQPRVDSPADLPLARTPEPPAMPPAAPIQPRPTEAPADDLPRVRPSVPPTPAPAATIQRQSSQDQPEELPLARSQELAPPPADPPPASIQRQADDAQPHDVLSVQPSEAPPVSPPAAPIQRLPSDEPTVLPLVRPPTPESPQPAESAPQRQSKEPGLSTGKAPPPEASGDAPVKPAAIRPRSAALNLARRAVQRILGEGPPTAATAPGQAEAAPPTEGDVPPRSGPGAPPAQIVRREQESQPDFALRRAPSVPTEPQEPGPGAASGPTARAETSTGAPRAAPIPVRIQRAPAPMSATMRAERGGEAIAVRPDRGDVRPGENRDDSLPLVVPLLAAQSQSAARHLQRAESSGPPGESAPRAAPRKTLRRTLESPSVGASSEPAPKSGLEPAPDQPTPAKGNEPDLNYDLLAQRVYPFIRRLLAFERERERGS